MRPSSRLGGGAGGGSENELHESPVRIRNSRDTEIDVETFSPGGEGDGDGIDDDLLPKGPRPGPSKPRPTFPPSPTDPPIVFTGSIPDMNAFQHKKTVAQGMMDIALLSANANQLRYVLEIGRNHPYYYESIALIGISIVLQVCVGMCLIWNSRYNVTCTHGMRKAERINNWLIFGVFIITVANVFISAFGISFEIPVVSLQFPRTAPTT